MVSLLFAVAFFGLIAWLVFPRRRVHREPEDSVSATIDAAALAEAERELQEDEGARAFGAEEEPQDDWGPGAP